MRRRDRHLRNEGKQVACQEAPEEFKLFLSIHNVFLTNKSFKITQRAESRGPEAVKSGCEQEHLLQSKHKHKTETREEPMWGNSQPRRGSGRGSSSVKTRNLSNVLRGKQRLTIP